MEGIELKTRRWRTVREIKQSVARHYGITVADLEAPSRKKRFAHPRQIAMALSYRVLKPRGYSSPQIGREFGGRDHTTVLFACRKWGIAADPVRQELVRRAVRARFDRAAMEIAA